MSRIFPPLGPIEPDYGPREALEVQYVDPRVFSVLGITARRGYAPQLLPYVMPVVTIPLSALEGGEGAEDGEPFAGPVFATGAQINHAQLLNPAGSGVLVYVDAVQQYSSSNGSALSLSRYDTALTTLVGAGSAKRFGASASAAQLRHQTNAVRLGTELMMESWTLNQLPIAHYQITAPFILQPGTGILTSNNAGAGGTNLTTFQWREVPI